MEKTKKTEVTPVVNREYMEKLYYLEAKPFTSYIRLFL